MIGQTNKQPYRDYNYIYITGSRIHLNFRAGSTFPVPVCTVHSSMDRTTRFNKVVDTVRLYLGWMYLESDRLLLIFLPACRCTKSRCRLTVSHQTLQYKYIKLYSIRPINLWNWKTTFCWKDMKCSNCTLVYFKFIVRRFSSYWSNVTI